MRHSVFRGVFAIDLEEAATPDIGNDNLYEGNMEHAVGQGGRLPRPPPERSGRADPGQVTGNIAASERVDLHG